MYVSSLTPNAIYTCNVESNIHISHKTIIIKRLDLYSLFQLSQILSRVQTLNCSHKNYLLAKLNGSSHLAVHFYKVQLSIIITLDTNK